ncbi:uncharacterized protein DUF1918 [Saccharopolyspora erythraea NRRL 2338]|uniref:Uncharacterized protein n=2 Tax=Saccharopolyspora erythraea TaxID=1836 RepID=A4FP30_SACEN|nr:DUF1918 domain-containing protein [Saccharopolyspora erythraea]EQD83441.1 hypothetical protein N599_25215 [Saccharopolyspora erythraea D]PFG99446.1 uncharacterized protein DUF1918 [Saccharopolyspora erythraea NRRL 2338]QRK89355.1 DUF1918 domain-containing protein [Saccharopolyspora erythraea]CAM05805.1 hypothetical protein SACE_6639 [Saccharopolyspora erythraea NRRL 2338]
MKAAVGDQLHVHSKHVDEADQTGEILEVRGPDGAPPYLVRFKDGHQSLVYPGGDCEVEKPAAQQ